MSDGEQTHEHTSIILEQLSVLRFALARVHKGKLRSQITPGVNVVVEEVLNPPRPVVGDAAADLLVPLDVAAEAPWSGFVRIVDRSVRRVV